MFVAVARINSYIIYVVMMTPNRTAVIVRLRLERWTLRWSRAASLCQGLSMKTIFFGSGCAPLRNPKFKCN